MDGKRKVTHGPNFASNKALVPAARTNFPPRPGKGSIFETFVPKGIFFRGNVFPIFKGATKLANKESPIFKLSWEIR